MTQHGLRLYSWSELQALPEPEWQIDHVFTVSARVVIYGGSGEGKSFVALDMALSISVGGEWQGRSVRQGAVVYVAGEGGRSIRKRIKAWMQHNGIEDIPAAFFLLEGVQVKDENDVESLVALIKERGIEPVLIVLDTLARCFVGGDENSSKEMGEFVDGVERLIQESRATVMVLHHTGKDPTRGERGSNALRGAADVMILVSKKDDVVTVANTKQKDDEEFVTIKLQLEQVQVPDSEHTSCVLAPNGKAAKEAKKVCPQHLQETLVALVKFPEGTATRKALLATEGVPADRTLDAHLKALIKLGYLDKTRRGLYKATKKGSAATQSADKQVFATAASATNLKVIKGGKSPTRSAATATTPRRGW